MKSQFFLELSLCVAYYKIYILKYPVTWHTVIKFKVTFASKDKNTM